MSKKNKVLILHGWGGSDFPHWQAHLAMELAKNYGTVSFPLIQHPHYPDKKRWLMQLKSIMEEFQPDIAVCHSLANTLWFWYQKEEKKCRVKNLYMVSPPSLDTDLPTLSTFFPASLPDDIGAGHATLIVSDNDPYIDLEEAIHISQSINASLVTLSGAGHINTESGYGKWKLIEQLVMESS